MTIEEKAKAYDEAKLRMSAAYNSNRCTIGFMNEIFPELKESKDERIRKEIIIYLRSILFNKKYGDKFIEDWIAWLEHQCQVKDSAISQHENKTCKESDETLTSEDIRKGLIQYFSTFTLDTFAGLDPKKILSWLEKQGEQKPADNVEPKFKVGDWITMDGWNYHIDEVLKSCYNLSDINGNYTMLPHFSIDDYYRPWTIQDAKDGDVLCCKSGWTCIFKALNNHTNTFSSYCFMDNDKWFCNTGSECHTLDKAFIKAYNGEIHPATKEQRNLLFQKMKDAGYEWNAKKKELKKIE